MNLTHCKLDASTADLFHCIVAKLLYVAKRARPDLQVAVAFLCKRVKCPNVGDWKKLGRLVRYYHPLSETEVLILHKEKKNGWS